VNSQASSGFISIARVAKTQGRRGEVAAEVHSDVPGRFTPGMRLSALQADGSRRALELEELWPHKGFLVLKFVGVDSISETEPLIGADLQVPAAERGALDTGWNYVSDLIGCVLLDRDRQIGAIEDVQFGAGEAPLLIVAAQDEPGKKLEVPFAEAYLEDVDLRGKRVRMKLPEGLLAVNAPMTEEEKKEQASFARRKRR
jgi:16S rRNA processing protein RimM